MRIGNLNAGAAKLIDSLESLTAAWGDVTANWNDAASRKFEKDHLENLVPRVTAALDAIKRLEEVLARAQRDCE